MRQFLIPFKPAPPDGRIRQSVRGALVGAGIALFLLLLWAGGVFAQLRLRVNDAYYAPSPTSGNIVIVAIDNASLSVYGRTPSEWSRDIFADLLTIISDGGARTVGFDLLFSESTPQDEAFLTAIQNARQSEARTRVIMPIVGLRVHDEAPKQAVAYSETIAPHPTFLNVIDNIGFVNTYPDADNTIRRQISQVKYICQDADCADSIKTGYGFSIAVYLAYLRIPPSAISQVITSDAGRLWVTGERRIWVDENGLWMPNYFGAPATEFSSAFAVVSAVDVVEGRIDPAIFADKAVLVGVMNSTGITDLYNVPTSIDGSRMAGVEIHANAVESLLRNISFYEQDDLSQIITIFLVAVISGMIYAQLRWWWMLIVGAVLLVILMAVLILRFDSSFELANLFFAAVAVVLPVFGNQMMDIVTETMRRQRAEAQLRAEKEISALRLQIIEEKDRQNATLAELSMLKTRMIRMASHDLKNPLGIVITYGSLIIEDIQADPTVMRDDHSRFIESMVKSAHDMLTIIEEILNLEQLRSGSIKKDPLALGYVVKEVVAHNKIESAEKQQTITVSVPDESPLILGDYRQMFQAITNLVGNAVKYTPDNGKIDVRLTVHDAIIRLEVEDNGYGISEEGQQNLFKEFYRVRSNKTAHIQGTGLGLSLVKAVIEAHNGKIWVKSKEGVGSTFYVEIPKFEGTLDDE